MKRVYFITATDDVFCMKHGSVESAELS